ncbi:ANK_REP_REGION domain-containing protein [Psidium guajava]|nr:ANK_REP_REGION domain-containing protein [Psidium guajava]
MDPRLSKVIQYKDVTSLRTLLAEDPLIMEKAVLGPTAQTPLHVAALAGHGELVKEIVSRKPSFARELNHDGFTPLHIASATGNLEVTRELLTQGPDLCMMKDKGGRTPLHYAAIKGRVKVIEELLSQCPLALKDRTARGKTALHLAVENSQFEALKKLVEKVSKDGDADELLTAKDDDGNTISQLAVASKQLQILDFLRKQNMVGKDTIDVVSGDQLEEQANAKSRANRSKKAATKADSRDDDSSSSSMWSEVEEMVLVVASLIATITYQAGLSPPQTIWGDNMKLNARCTSHHSFFSSTNLCPVPSYYLFMSFNTSGFFSSIFLIFFFRKPSYVQVLLPVALLSMVVTYVTLSVTMSPNGLSLLLIYVITLAIFLYCMLAVEVVKTIFHKAYSFAAGKASATIEEIKRRRSSSANVSKAGA